MPTIKDKLDMSFKTIVEMLEDRKVYSEQDIAFLRSFGQNELTALMSKGVVSVDLDTRLRVMYYLNKFRMADFKPHLERCVGFDFCILIVGDKLTTYNTKSIHDFLTKSKTSLVLDVNLQIFELAEVLFNITHHVLVPRHEVISNDAEIEELVKRYNLKNRHQFPIILRTDPVARYFGLRSGQLVRITRVSPSAGEYVAYRCCV